MARRNQRVQGLFPEIQQMLSEGMTQKEATSALGLKGARPMATAGSTGHNKVSDEEREKESRCGVAVPQRPGLSIYFTGIC
ncbi:hypothetical protein [Beduinella massiliensis]|uniref:hypothetical protein n=1 Tax=Beduinella massiliensis TaxID=1852363 RepID=UPI0031F8C956